VNAATPKITPVPSEHQAAAIVAALAHHHAQTAAPPPAGRDSAGGWVRAARLAAVSRRPQGPARWGD
jgi:hypothetical protein